jgi:hypothetical protein
MALGSLHRGRLFGWLAENAATTFAQTSPLPAHAGGNTLHTRNFRRAKSKNIAGAKPALIVLRKCVTHCRQHCQTESQTRYGLEITNCEQSNWHSRPLRLDRPTLRSFARRLAALESTIIVSTRLPILQDSQPTLHRNSVSALTARSHPLCRTSGPLAWANSRIGNSVRPT